LLIVEVLSKSTKNYDQGDKFTFKSVVRNRVYTGKTHAGGFQTFDFCLVRAGGLCLCSRDF